MTYVSIANKLTELVEEVEGIEYVYNHDPNQLEGFPAATVTAVGHRDSFRDTAANTRRFSFMVRLFYRTDIDEDAETILRDLADQVITQLEANVIVQGVWDIARPTEATWRSGEREVPVLVVELTVAIEKRVNRSA